MPAVGGVEIVAETLGHRTHPAGQRYVGAEWRHRFADDFSPVVGDRWVLPHRWVGVLTGMGRYDQRPVVGQHRLESAYGRLRAAGNPAERVERRVDEEDAAVFDAEHAEVRGERIHGFGFAHALDDICLGHTRPSAGPGFNLWCRLVERATLVPGNMFDMSYVPARDAPRYVTGDDAIALFAATADSWALLIIGAFTFVGYGFGLIFVLRIVALLAGALVAFVGVVGLAYKLLVDSRRTVSE